MLPDYPDIQCKYLITKLPFVGYTSYDCPEDEKVIANCEKIDGGLQNTFVIIQGHSLYINPTTFFGAGDMYLDAEFPSWGLKVEFSSNYKEETTTSCAISSITAIGDVHVIDVKEPVVLPDNPFNVVTGSHLAKSTQLVKITGVNGGRPIYISRPGFYHTLDEAVDGFDYVNTGKEYSSVRIECIPRTTGCNDDAELVDLTEQSCAGEEGGTTTDYLLILGTNKLCKWECDTSKNLLVMTSDCKVIPEKCPDSKPLWDASTGECISQSEDSEREEIKQDLFFVYLFMGTILFLLVMLFIKMATEGRR